VQNLSVQLVSSAGSVASDLTLLANRIRGFITGATDRGQESFDAQHVGRCLVSGSASFVAPETNIGLGAESVILVNCCDGNSPRIYGDRSQARSGLGSDLQITGAHKEMR
jgi:hypothetical protein